MQLDGAIFSIERRHVGGCIDLAVVFFREHMLTILALTAVFAVPSCSLVWFIADSSEDTFFLSQVLFVFLSPLLGATLVAGCGRRVFGDSFTAGESLRLALKRIVPLMLASILVRLGSFALVWLLLIPALLLATRYGFMAEILYLEQQEFGKIGRRISSLTGVFFFRLCTKLIRIWWFYCVIVLSMFVTVDIGARVLFGFPILIGRIPFEFNEFFAWEFQVLFFSDPRFLTTLHAMLWLAYPIARIAWLFCYLDARIRKEGWDLDLDVQIETQRVEAAL